MGIGNCSECGTLYVETPSRLCNKCQEDYYEAEEKVADYLHEHQNSTIDAVYEATKVKKHIIMRMIRNGRVIEGELCYSCERCGKAITSGQFCADCTANALKSLASSNKTDAELERRGAGMHISSLLDKK